MVEHELPKLGVAGSSPVSRSRIFRGAATSCGASLGSAPVAASHLGTIERLLETDLRDAVGSTIYSGTSEMQRNIIARWLGLESDG